MITNINKNKRKKERIKERTSTRIKENKENGIASLNKNYLILTKCVLNITNSNL